MPDDNNDVIFYSPEELAEAVLSDEFDDFLEDDSYEDDYFDVDDDEPENFTTGRKSRQRIRAVLRDFDDESDDYLDLG